MATPTKYYQFSEDLCKAKHDFSTHTIVLALSNAANAPDITTDAVLADITQISYTNLSSRTLTGVTAEQTAGVCNITFTDLVISASGGAAAPFRYITFYNDTTSGDPLIQVLDYGSDLTLQDGQSLTVDSITGAMNVQ